MVGFDSIPQELEEEQEPEANNGDQTALQEEHNALMGRFGVRRNPADGRFVRPSPKAKARAFNRDTPKTGLRKPKCVNCGGDDHQTSACRKPRVDKDQRPCWG